MGGKTKVSAPGAGRVARAALALTMLAVALALAPAAAAERRTALVIGNGAYQQVPPLANPVNDARAVAAELQRLGFEVIEGYDLGIGAMLERLRRFGEVSAEAQVALIYYAGHGMQVAGRNFLLPVDAKLAREADLRREAVEVDEVLAEARPARRVRVLILDACRDNPFPARMARGMGSRSALVGRGFARVDEAEADTLVAYATKADAIAEDGTGPHSPYTAALLQHLAVPGLTIERLFGRVRDSVVEATQGRQQPFTYGSLGGEPIYLKPEAAAAAPAPVPVAIPVPVPAITVSDAAELAFWDAIKASGNPADYRAYLETYPQGRFASLARVRARAEPAEPEAARTVPVPAPALAPAPAALPALTVGAAALECGGLPEGEMLQLCRRALDGEIDSQLELAERLERGNGIGRNEAVAARFYRLAADRGSAAGQAALAALLLEGRGVERNPAESLRYLRLAAGRGQAGAQYQLGLSLDEGRGAAADPAAAAGWYRQAAGQGHGPAAVALARLLESGRGLERDDAEALRWYRVAAEQGLAAGQNGLGRLLEDGRGVAADEAAAVGWYRKAAEQGLALAQYNLAVALDQGRGGAEDPVEAARWYRLAAEQGHADAQATLGLAFERGRGVPRQPAEAARWFRLAAGQGLAHAQVLLAGMLEQGRGVARDLEAAVHWYGQAAAQGEPLARAALVRLGRSP